MATDPEYLDPSDAEDAPETVEPVSSALEIISKSEHAAMVATANMKENRRNIEAFSSKLMSYATHSQLVALNMFYSLPRANKQIVGASVRFAEIVAPCWKNNSTGARIVGLADKTVTAQGVFLDFEANIRNVKEVPRRITDSKGNIFNDDMILTTSKAALSIAYRDAILKGGVPMALWSPAYDAAKLTAVGKAVSHSERVANAMEYLTKLKVTEWQIMNAIGCASPNDMETDHLLTLKVLCEEIKRGEKSIEEVFGSPLDKEIDAMFAALQKNATEQRTLRHSYRGNAQGLFDWLKQRMPSVTTQSRPVDTEKKEPAPAQNTTPPAEEKKPEPKKGGGKKKGDAEPAAQPDAAAATQQADTATTTEEKKPETEPAQQQQGAATDGTFNF